MKILVALARVGSVCSDAIRCAFENEQISGEGYTDMTQPESKLAMRFDVAGGSDPETNEVQWFQSLIDFEDFDRVVKGHHWTVNDNYVWKQDSKHDRFRGLTHFILGEPPDEFRTMIDHINGDTLDNRKQNLRWVDAQENSNNRPQNPPLNEAQFPLDVRSEFIDPETFRTRTQMCIKWHKPSKRWKVRNFSYEREPEYFKNLTEACEAHDKRCREAWEAAYDSAGRKRARKNILLKRNAIGESETGSDGD